MSTRNQLLAAALGAALLFPASGVLAQDVSKVMGSIDVEAGQAVGDVDTVNGRIRIAAGASLGDAATVNGSIEAGDGARLASVETVNGRITLGHDVHSGSLETVNGRIRTGERARIGGDVESVNGSVFIDRGSRVDGDIETVNGSIGLVGTEVTGDIETVNADLTVGAGSHVRGRVHYEKPQSTFPLGTRRTPRVIIGPGAVVDGPLVFEHEVELFVHDTARTGTVTGATAQAYSGEGAPARD